MYTHEEDTGTYQETTLRDIFDTLYEGRKIIALTTTAFFLATIIILFFLTSQYTASVTLYPAENDGAKGGISSLAKSFGGVAELTGIDLGGSGDVEKSIATFNSREVMSEFITSHNLLPLLFPKDWDKHDNNWAKAKGIFLAVKFLRDTLSGKSPASFDPSYQRSSAEIIQRFGQRVGIDQNKRTGIVTLTVTWNDPKTAAWIANEFTKFGNNYIRMTAINMSKRKMQFLEEQLKNYKQQEMQNLIYKIVEKELGTQMYANVNVNYAFQVIDKAVEPQTPSFPRKAVMLLASIFFGIFFGIIYIFLRGFFENKKN